MTNEELIDKLEPEMRNLERELVPAWREIRRLSDEVERLREALTSIAYNACCNPCQEAANVAREALR